MDSRSHSRTVALIGRYLDPRVPWTGRDDAALRAHLRECDPCAGVYDRAVVKHRLMVGSDPDAPSGFERQRMMAATLDLVAGPAPRSVWSMFAWPALAAGVAAAVAVAVVQPWRTAQDPTGQSEYVGVRGGAEDPLTAGIGLSGVTEDKKEYEIVAGGTSAYVEDYLRVYTTVVDPALRHVFVFGLQDDRPIWYLPDPADGGSTSVPVERGKSIVLGGKDHAFELKLSGRHTVGRLAVVAIFTAQPVTLAAVEEALGARTDDAELESRLKTALSLDSGAIIRKLVIDIVPGSRQEGDHEQ